ncbi:hypothetical protein RCL1_004369 [Eukaryota sp. TZLM3-RCL]
MGVHISSLSPQLLEQIKTETSLTEEEIQLLFHRFQSLDKDSSGGLDLEEIQNLSGFTLTPLRQHLLSVLDEDGDTNIDFGEFLTAFSAFSPSGTTEQRTKFLFKVYDMDRDGFISENELYKSLKLMVGESLTDLQLQQVVSKSLALVDRDGDGKISLSEFQDFLTTLDLKIDRLSIPILNSNS